MIKLAIKRLGSFPGIVLCALCVALLQGAGTKTKAAAYNVRDFGAVGNGSRDDTGALQKALDRAARDSGTVYLPNGTYRITRTLEFSLPTGRHGASLEGESMTKTVLSWDGPGGPVLRIRGAFGSRFCRFTIQGSERKKPSAAIDWPADAAHPSAGASRIEQVFIDQAKVGMDFCRASDRQVSEVTISDCIVQSAETAYRIEGWNALNFLFINCGATHSGISWEFVRTNSHQILSGSCSQVKTVMSANAGGVITMQGVRAEHCGRLAELGPVSGGAMGVTGAALQARIRDCSFVSYAGDLYPDKHAIRIGAPGPVAIEGCQFAGGNIGVWVGTDTHPVISVRDSVFDKSATPILMRHGAPGGLLKVSGCRIVDIPAGGSPVGFVE